MPETGPPPDPFADPRPPAAPPHVPGYKVLKRLGKGGMATVWLATQQSLDRPVAIKVMQPEALRDETSKVRFENEARTIARLTHPGIVAIHEVGRTDEGLIYYVMSYLANGDLSRRNLAGDENRIADVLRTLLQALGHAHAHGIVHRDVKRENVLFDATDRPLLTDFGIAMSKAPDAARLTSAGMALGSSGTMAPEQARGAVVDGRADLYSVGVLAYELLTGTLPFAADDPLALALMHSQDPVPRLPPHQRHWQAFIDRAMAKVPEHRFADAGQMLEALERLLRTAPGAAAAVDDGKRGRWMLAVASVFLLAVLAYGWTQLASDDAPVDERFVVATEEPASDAPPAPATTKPPAPAEVPEETPPEPAPTEHAPPADAEPPPAEPAPATEPAKRPTIGDRAKNAKNKVKRWFRRR